MAEFFRDNQWSFAIFVGLLVFISLAFRFSHFKMRQVEDKSVVALCIIVSAFSGLIVALFVKVILSVFFVE